MKNDLIEIQYYPQLKNEETSLIKYNKISIDKISDYGIFLEPLIQMVFKDENKGGFCFVKVPKGAHLATKKASGHNIGALLSDKTGGLVGQADIISIPIDPATLVLAVALSKIENKLNDILETQTKIMDFLIEKEKSKMRANLLTLTDVHNNYKYNLENSNYKNNKHILVQEIRREAEQQILFYKDRIEKNILSKKLMAVNKDILNKINELNGEFKEYQLALYLYSFSTYLEVLLLENQNLMFIQDAYSKIQNYSYDYRILYTKTYDFLDEDVQRAMEGYLFGGIYEVGKLFGKVADKLPARLKLKNEEKKLEQLLEDTLVNKTKESLKDFTQNRDSFVQPFINQLETLEDLYSNDVKLLIDDKNIYIE